MYEMHQDESNVDSRTNPTDKDHAVSEKVARVDGACEGSARDGAFVLNKTIRRRKMNGNLVRMMGEDKEGDNPNRRSPFSVGRRC